MAEGKSTIFSLSGIGSALGGVFFEDPAESDEEPQQSEDLAKKQTGGKSAASSTTTSSSSSSSGSSGSASASSSSSRSGAGSAAATATGGGDDAAAAGAPPATAPAQAQARSSIMGSIMGATGGAVGYVVPTFGLMSPKKNFPLPQKAPSPRQRGERPLAGRTCAGFLRPQGLTEEFHTWYSCEANSFSLRVGPNYEKNKGKGPSADALFEVVGIDVYKCSSKIDNIGSKVQLPAEWTSVKTGHDKVPPVFIVQSQLPEVSLIGMPSFISEIVDGPGWSLTIYFKMKESTVALLKDVPNAPGGVKLLHDFCSNAPEQESNPKSPYRGRFKVIPRIDNIEELSLPYIISSYNCKPALIVKTGSVYRGEGYIEVDVNVHQFGTAARTALQVMRFDLMTANFGFCIESRDDAEMPEVILGCLCLNRTLLSIADEWVH